MRKMVVALAFVVSVVSALPVLPRAEAASCGSRDSYHIGKDHNVSNIGSMGKITYKEPTLCGAVHSDSSVWVMSSGGDNYIQAGYGKDSDDAHAFMFTEWSASTGIYFVAKVDYTQYPGSANYYKVGLDTTSNIWYMAWSSDGSIWTNYDSVQDSSLFEGTVPAWTKYHGEIKDSGDAIPGSSASPVVFSNLQYKTTAGAWTTESSLNPITHPSIAGHAKLTDVSATSFKLYDTYNP